MKWCSNVQTLILHPQGTKMNISFIFMMEETNLSFFQTKTQMKSSKIQKTSLEFEILKIQKLRSTPNAEWIF